MKTTVIRHTEGIIRDLLIRPDSQDPAKKVLMIRQTRFDGPAQAKSISLTEEEVNALITFWEKNS